MLDDELNERARDFSYQVSESPSLPLWRPLVVIEERHSPGREVWSVR
jgi:hypothetical protein